MIEPSLRLIRALVTKGLYLLDCEVTPLVVIPSIIFIQDGFKVKDGVTLRNIDNENDRITLIFPCLTINDSPVHNLQLKRINND